MATKRSAFEAFGKPNGSLSAFAAAKQAKLAILPTVDNGALPHEESLEPGINGNLVQLHDDSIVSEDLSAAVENAIGGTLPRVLTLQLSSFVPTSENIQQDDESILQLLLRAYETITVVGIYDVEVIAGMATIYGTLLHPEVGRQRVYAPSTQALPQLVSRRDGTSIRITSVKSGISKLDRLSPMFRNIWASNDAKHRSFTALPSSEDDTLRRSLSLLEVDGDSRKALFGLNARHEKDNSFRPVIMAIGSKSTGKSTFNRLLCNMINCRWSTESCLYLDLDPGQPEFGPPGQLSLVEVEAPILGPSFAHPASRSSRAYRLIRSHTIAAMSFKDEPQHYLDCALNLFRHAQSTQSIRSLPLIINSCGWVSGFGASAVFQIARDTKVTDIIQLGPIAEELSLSLDTLGCTTHLIARRPTRPSTRTPAELRAMQTMAYFHQKPQISDPFPSWTSKPLTSLRPWEVSYHPKTPGIHAILSYSQNPLPEFLAEVLDGAIVAIVLLSPEAASTLKSSRTPTEDIPYIQPDEQGTSLPLDPRESSCLGLALIRGIDLEAKKLLLLTPLTETELAELPREAKMLLVRGGFDSPDWAYLEDVHAAKDRNRSTTTVGGEEAQRPWVTRRERVGVEGAVWRLRHPPMASGVNR